MFLHIFLGRCNRFLDGQSVQVQITIWRNAFFRRIAYDAFFRIETFFAYIASFHQRNNRQAKMLCKRIVTAVVSRNRHNGSRTVSRQHVIADPDRHSFTRKRIDSIRTAEYTRHTAVRNAFTLCTFLRAVKVSLHFSTLPVGSQLRNQLTFGCQHHECYAKHRIGTSGENGKLHVTVLHLEAHFRTFRTTDPVALRFFQRISPVNCVQTVKQTLGIRRNSQAPLAHFLLHHRMAATFRHTVNNLVIGKHRA